MVEAPRLPPIYRLVTLARESDVRAEAAALARADAEDGSLVWAAPGAADPDQNLRIALVLYPESSLEDACQLVYVAALGLGDALGALMPAGTEVLFAWPDRVELNGGTAAEITLDYGETSEPGRVPWVVLGLSVNVTSARRGTVLDVAVLREEGLPEATAGAVLEAFARHFLGWVNRWLDDGFEPVRAMWLRHTPGAGTTVEVPVGRSRTSGALVEVDARARLVLKDKGGRRRALSLTRSPCVRPSRR